MKKIISFLVVVCITCGVLSGCSAPKKKLPKFERLGFICSENKEGTEVYYGMNRDKLRELWGDNTRSYYDRMEVLPSSERGFGIEVWYDNEKNINNFTAQNGAKVKSTFGFAQGDSISSVKDILGEPQDSWSDSSVPRIKSLKYFFIIEKNGYRLYDGTYEDWKKTTTNLENSKDFVQVTIGISSDKITYITIKNASIK